MFGFVVVVVVVVEKFFQRKIKVFAHRKNQLHIALSSSTTSFHFFFFFFFFSSKTTTGPRDINNSNIKTKNKTSWWLDSG